MQTQVRMWECVLLLLVMILSVEGLCPDKINGIVRWSQWQSAPTSVGATVNIAASATILLDVSPQVLEHIDVYGTLVFDPAVAAINLTVGSIYVRKGGKMYLGTSECPMTNKVTINLKGVPKVGADPDGVGTKVLGVLQGGLLEIHGNPRKPVWTVLADTAAINSTSITLIESVDWAVGEKLVIATTDFENFDDSTSYPGTQNEEVIVTGRPSSTVVEFTPALKYTHYGKIWTGQNGDQIDMRGEVGVVNRNILIQGDLSDALSGNSLDMEWGGHVMIRDGGVARIEYMEVTNLGQRGEFGRYPLHFHNASTQPDSYLRGNSIHNTFQRCIVVHSTFNLRVQNNFAYRGKGHCYFIEDGNEEQNVFDHNLGIKAVVGTLLKSDNEPAMFWTTNPLNHYYRNVAVGGKMGFWFSMPVSPLALSASQVDNRLRYKANGDFIGNKGHSANFGLFIDRGQENAKPGASDKLTDYNPTNWTAALALAQQLGVPIDFSTLSIYDLIVTGYRVPARFVDFTAYKSAEEGMWGRGSYMHSYGAKLADNVVGCIWPGSGNLMQNTIMVGETDNIGTFNYFKNAWWGDEEGRTRPLKYFMNVPVVGYSSYDASGGDLVIDITFYNFNDYTFTKGTNAGKERKSGALTGLTGPNVIEPMNRVYRAKFYNVQNRVYIREYYPWDTNLPVTDDAVKGIVWVDGDGSILNGLPEAGCGKSIVGPGPHIRTSDCVQKSGWNAWICNANTNARRAFYLSQSGAAATYLSNKTEMRLAYDIHLNRLSSGAAQVDIEANIGTYSGELLKATYSYGTNIVVNNNYYITLGNKNTFLSDFGVSLNDMSLGEKVRIAFPFSASETPVVKYGYNADGATTEVSSYNDLTINTYYFDKSANLLWVHLEVSSEDYEYYYSLPSKSSYVAMHVSSSCSRNADSLCSYPSRAVPANPANIPAVTANLCDNGGAVTGGITSYSTKSSDSYVVFDDNFHDSWSNSTNLKCNISSDLVYEGKTALRCKYKRYDYGSFYRVWSASPTPIPLSSYTHVQLAVRAAPGHGDLRLGFSMFNQSWTQFSTAPLHSPFYTDNAGPINDEKWTVVTVPLPDFKIPSNLNLWGIAVTTTTSRPVEFYMDNIKFVSLNSKVTPISNYPVGPQKPSLVGPGPSDSYGTDPPVDNPHIDSAANKAISSSLFVLIVLIIFSL